MITVAGTRRWILNGRGAMWCSVTNIEMSSPDTGQGEKGAGNKGGAGESCTCLMTLVAPLDGDLVWCSGAWAAHWSGLRPRPEVMTHQTPALLGWVSPHASPRRATPRHATPYLRYRAINKIQPEPLPFRVWACRGQGTWRGHLPVPPGHAPSVMASLWKQVGGQELGGTSHLPLRLLLPQLLRAAARPRFQ